MSYRAVMFDLDGTLLDTLADLASSTNAALHRFGCPEHPIESYKTMVGDGVENLARRAMPPQQRQEEEVQRCVAAIREEYEQRWAERTQPYPGIAELLEALHQRGIILTVLSNKPDDLTRRMVNHWLGCWPFAAVRGARPGIPRKPDPGAALEIARTLAIVPAQFLYLGDTNTDMQTARSAGMMALGARWGFRSAEELRQSGAQALLARPQELLSWLEA